MVVRNPYDRPERAVVRLVVPAGWPEPAPQEVELAPLGEDVARFALDLAGIAQVARARVGADLTVGGTPFGQQAEALVDVAMRVEKQGYALEVSADGLRVTIGPRDGATWLTLRPQAAFDTVEAWDETIEVSPPRVDGDRIEFARRSTLWERAVVTVECTDEQVELRASVTGRGRLADVKLLALRSLLPEKPSGLLPSGYAVGEVTKLYCANPAHPTGVRPVHEPAVIGVTGDGEPGRHHWFFTPAPLYLAWAREDESEWLDLGVAAPVKELTFVELGYVPRDGGFHLQLEYEGHTAVDGEFSAPALVFTPGVPDPATGLRRHRDDLVARDAAPPVAEREQPAWWTEPIFCGWGAQFHLHETVGGTAMDHATQANYDGFLATLAGEGLTPGTVVLDDKWQTAYGTNEPDREKWPDLKSWVAARHGEGRHVLLWWKAWDPEGLPPDALHPQSRRCAGRGRPHQSRDARGAGAAADGAARPRRGSTPTGSRSTSPPARRADARCPRTATAGGSPSCTSCSTSSTAQPRTPSPTR